MSAARTFTPIDAVRDEMGLCLLLCPPEPSPSRTERIARRLIVRLASVAPGDRRPVGRRVLQLLNRAQLTALRGAVLQGLRELDRAEAAR